MGNRILIKKDSFTKSASTVKFTFLEAGINQSGFLVFFKGNYYAYRNKCQHLSVELDWDNNEFFDEVEKYIVCSTHGALYDPSSGRCIMGPCEGKNLEILKIKVLDDKIIITI
tara:strand:- start:1886 stop:2224 length:339 start_codon:yes stop_codon:yes gene_type:complete